MFCCWWLYGYLLTWATILHKASSQVAVSSSAAASVKYPDPDTPGQPQAYISSLSSAKADPKIPVTVVDGVAVEHPKKTWGYRDTPDAYGPENWSKIAPKCAGMNQSPINIVTANAVEKNIESPIAIAMDDPSGAGLIKGRLINNGKTIGFEVGPNSPPVRFTGEVTEGHTFVLKQFHLHFGCEGKKGSEHSIDGERFSGEMHLVFKNEKYENPKVAMQQKDGLAILAFFLQVRPNADPNPAFEKIAKNIPNIQFAKQQLNVPGGLSIINLIPPLQDGLVNLKRYVYKGSLPTPPCYESVTWIVFNRAIGIQPNKLPQKIFTDTGTLMCDNFRRQMELNDREVFRFVEIDSTPIPSSTPQTSVSNTPKAMTSKAVTLKPTSLKTMPPKPRTPKPMPSKPMTSKPKTSKPPTVKPVTRQAPVTSRPSLPTPGAIPSPAKTTAPVQKTTMLLISSTKKTPSVNPVGNDANLPSMPPSSTAPTAGAIRKLPSLNKKSPTIMMATVQVDSEPTLPTTPATEPTSSAVKKKHSINDGPPIEISQFQNNVEIDIE